MANPYRDVCARMADELDHYRQLLMDDRREAHALATEARALLAQPVPVSERLPVPDDCDAEGRCWIFMPDIGTDPSWRLTDPRDIGPYHTHWLPANALPTPEATNG